MDWSGMRVLIVGRRDAPSVGSARVFLSAQGARLDLCDDPSEALALLAGEGYEALLVCVDDLGAETLGPVRAIRRLHPEAAIIASAAPEARRLGLVALQLGADALLPAPFYGDELLTLIERVRGRIEGGAGRGAARLAADLLTAAESAGLSAPPDAMVVDAGLTPGDVVVADGWPPAADHEPPAPGPEPTTGAPEPPFAMGVSADEQAALREWPDEEPDLRPEPEPAAPAESAVEVEGRKSESREPSPAGSGTPQWARAEGPRSPLPQLPVAAESGEPPPLSPLPVGDPGGYGMGGGLPRAEEHDEPAPFDSPAAAATERALKRQGVRGRILLVDRERLFRELVADVLRQVGYYVADAADERQALWCLAEDDYDAIVMDARVSGHNGQTVQAFREASPETPVVVITSLASREQESALLAAGAAACLGKPFDMEQLTQVLTRIMAPRRPAHPILTPEELDALLAPDPGAALTTDSAAGRDEPDMGF